ncbi:hypothetical protein AB0O31_31240 [Kitasatospora cineracea]|uniref:hypothetical protein n=1 Tax=Kitasatospora cineracea TaxID=88074 RepID=UPI00343764C5
MSRSASCGPSQSFPPALPTGADTRRSQPAPDAASTGRPRLRPRRPHASREPTGAASNAAAAALCIPRIRPAVSGSGSEYINDPSQHARRQRQPPDGFDGLPPVFRIPGRQEHALHSGVEKPALVGGAQLRPFADGSADIAAAEIGAAGAFGTACRSGVLVCRS